jgi:hypothetical protein
MTITAQIGWIFKDNATTQVILPKQHFNFGEPITVIFNVDNRDAGAIKELKVKLVRRFQTNATIPPPHVLTATEYVQVWKFPGVPGKVQESRQCTFQLPTNYPINQDALTRLAPDQTGGLMPCSFTGKIVAVEYWLKCFTKYSALTDTGEG